MVRGVFPPVAVLLACIQIWLCVLFYFLFQTFMMGTLYLTAVVIVLIVVGLNRFVFEPLDEEISKRVLFKDNLKHLPIYAHRGGAYDAPENTIVAIREAKKNGADGVEIDLSFTKDNIAVLFHDETIERTTNGVGKLTKITYDGLRELDASSNHIYQDRFKGAKVPSFTEAIEECLTLGLKVIIDVKEYDNRAVVVIADAFSKHKELYEKAVVASFFASFIYQLRRVDPNIITALTWRPKFVSYDHIPNGRPRFNSWWKMSLAGVADTVLDWATHNLFWYFTGVSAVLIHKDSISAEYVRMWRDRGISVIAWTPNHRLEKDYFMKSLNISYITDTMLS